VASLVLPREEGPLEVVLVIGAMVVKHRWETVDVAANLNPEGLAVD
jgi:hypothetical protein